MNQATHYLDGSSIYGSSEKVALDLRSSEAKGRLDVQEEQSGDLLPLSREPNHRCQYSISERNSINDTCFRAGELFLSLKYTILFHCKFFIRESVQVSF